MLLIRLIFQVVECRLVVDPRTRESRGFGFVTMDNGEDADRCVKYLNRSTLEGRIITVEKVSSRVMECLLPYCSLSESKGQLLNALLRYGIDHACEGMAKWYRTCVSYTILKSKQYNFLQ